MVWTIIKLQLVALLNHYQYFLSTGRFPESCKVANVIPIPKSRDKGKACNYSFTLKQKIIMSKKTGRSIIVTTDLSWSQHIQVICSKAKSVLSII